MDNHVLAPEAVGLTLAVAATHLADAVHDHVVTLAARMGSTTAPAVRYIHSTDATARAIGLPKSVATVIAALPVEDRAVLALIRAGVAARIPQWAAQVETARRLLEELLALWRDRLAHDGAAALPALEAVR